jgi:membrane-associated phospholipid phosphatase
MTKRNTGVFQRFILAFLFIISSFIANSQQTVDTIVSYPDSVQAANAQLNNTDSQHLYRINGRYLRSVWLDVKGVASAPFHWKGKDWAKFGALTGAATVLYFSADKPAREMILHNRNEFNNSVAEVVYPLGNRLPPLLIAGMYVTSIIAKDRKLEHSTLSIAKSLAVSTLFYTASKSVIRRQRPTRTDDPHLFAPPFSGDGYTSFPSGHANTAFSVATAFALEYKHKKWVPWVAYSLATLTAVGRMYQDRHWSSDVLIGSAMGHFITKTIYRLEKERKVVKKDPYAFLR